MKALLLLASLSFASAVMLVPHDGNEKRTGVYDAVLPENSTDTSNIFVNQSNNTKHRPHLAIVENRKLFEAQNNHSSNSSDTSEEHSNRRKLLISMWRRPAPRAPPPAPRAPPPAPRAPPPAPRAPPPAPRAAPPAPRAAPPAPRAAPPAPKAAPPAPKPAPPAPKIVLKSAPKPAPKLVFKPAPRIVLRPVPRAAPLARVVSSIKPRLVAPVAKVIAKVVTNVKSRGFKLYGNYCGPNYCGGQQFKGAEGPNCIWGVMPKDSLDACCKAHDHCCGTPSTRSTSCNRHILSCINQVNCKDAKCKLAQLAMVTTFRNMQNHVCGKLIDNKSTVVTLGAMARSAPMPLVVVNKYSSVDSKLSAKTKEIAKKFESAFAAWVVTTNGQDAVKFCQSLGITNKKDIYNGCIEDMRVTKSKSIAKESAIAAEEFLAKAAENPSKRFCVASGDPHITNYDGTVFHIQEPGIYTVARTPDNVFEIQEKMRKNGANKPGVPSCMTGVVVHYKQMNIEVDVANFGKIRVNGQEMELPEDFTLTFGGLQIRYGNQVVEWKGASVKSTGLKITAPNGFSVMVSGGYCGVLETNVPTTFFGKMQGICGNADGVKSAADYMDPNGATMNVNYGSKNWEMSGYNGPNAPLSKWQLSWKPRGSECYFTKDCEGGVQTRKVIVSPTIAPVVAPAPVIARAPVVAPVIARAPVVAPVIARAPTQVVAPVSAKSVPTPVVVVKSTPASVVVVGSSTTSKSTSKSSSSSASSKRRQRTTVCKPEVFPPTSHKTIKKQVAEISANTSTKMKDLYTKFKSMMHEMQKKQREQFEADSKILTEANSKSSDSYVNYKKIFDISKQILGQINMLNITLHRHHKVIAQESEYLARLEKFKPKFLFSLDNIKAHVTGIKNDIHSTIVEGSDKNGLLSILEEIRSSTDKSATLLAKAFLDHYDKYTKQLKVDTTQYDEELKRMGFLSSTYTTSVKEGNTLWKEYSDILGIANKLKTSMKFSKDDEKSFDDLLSKVTIAFKKQSEKSGAKLSTPNTNCAADVLKAHIDHNRV